MTREPESVPFWLPAATFLAKGPRYLWSYALWRSRRTLARQLSRAPRWPRAPSALPEQGAATLREHFLRRARPLPLVTASACERVVAALPAAQRERTCRAADRIVERRFSYRGHELSFAPGAVDWRAAPGGNTDWTWDLNRHHFAVELGRAYRYTGSERYAEAFRELFLDWLAKNPPGVAAPAWQSVFEVGVRAVNWCWAHALLLAAATVDDALHEEFLRGILGTGRFLRRHLERHAWNNHLLLEAKALAMLGLLYPELPGSATWARDGLSVLAAELRRQVCPDGVHSERSTFYHKLIASELLEMLVVLRLAARHDSTVAAALAALCRFLQAITRDDGSIPLLGDSSRHDAHVRFDALLGAAALLDMPELRARRAGRQEEYAGDLREGTTWLLAALAKDVPEASAAAGGKSMAFPAGGYWVLRAAAGSETVHLVFDCGPFGDPVVAGHGHADALALDLAVGGQHLLVDPGMYSAHLGATWRNHFRGTAAHNTVRVDERDQSVLAGVRRVYFPARARATLWRTTPLYDRVRGEHDGYLRLAAPLCHEREVVFLKPDLFVVADRLLGDGEHLFETCYQFPPGAELEREDGALAFRGAEGRGLLVAPLDPRSGDGLDVIAGRESPPGGWVAYRSGVKEPAPAVAYRTRARAPFTRTTVLALLFAPAMRVERSPLPVGAERPDGPAAGTGAARLSRDGREDILVLAQGGRTEERGVVKCGAVRTDARILVLARAEDGALRRALVIDGTFLEIAGEPAFIASTAPADHAFDGETWQCDAAPPTER